MKQLSKPLNTNEYAICTVICYAISMWILKVTWTLRCCQACEGTVRGVPRSRHLMIPITYNSLELQVSELVYFVWYICVFQRCIKLILKHLPLLSLYSSQDPLLRAQGAKYYWIFNCVICLHYIYTLRNNIHQMHPWGHFPEIFIYIF